MLRSVASGIKSSTSARESQLRPCFELSFIVIALKALSAVYNTSNDRSVTDHSKRIELPHIMRNEMIGTAYL